MGDMMTVLETMRGRRQEASDTAERRILDWMRQRGYTIRRFLAWNPDAVYKEEGIKMDPYYDFDMWAKGRCRKRMTQYEFAYTACKMYGMHRGNTCMTRRGEIWRPYLMNM